jgi:transcriptional regulator with XRE-family HTH domain
MSNIMCGEDGHMPKAIKDLRRSAGLTQLELANRLGVTPGTVYKWERGSNEPTATNLRDLARALGVSMEEIDLGVWDAKSAA